MQPNLKRDFRVLCMVAIAVVMVGASLRFGALARRVVWIDESGTMQRVSGYWLSDLEREVFDGRVHTMDELGKFQHIAPDRGIGSIVEGLAREEAPWPPLYFVLLRLWAGLFGDSVWALRLFSACVSLLVFPVCFWFCRELFPGETVRDRSVAWVAVALLAASPFLLVYGQEARAYALWTVLLFAACAMFLRAFRTGRLGDSLGYGVLVALGLYAFPLTILMVAAHGIYALIRVGFRLRRALVVLAAGWALGVLLFAPWLWVIARNLRAGSESVSWTATTEIPLPFLAYSWLSNVIRVFFDLPSVVLWLEPWLGFGWNDVVYGLIGALVVAFLVFAVIRFAKTPFDLPTRPRSLLLLLASLPFLTLAVPDLVLGGIRSFSPRHQTLGLVTLELIVAIAIASGLGDPSRRMRRLFRGSLAALIVLGLVSGVAFTRSRGWWNKYISSDNDRVAAMLNASERPLLVGLYGGESYSRNVPFYFLYLTSMSHVLKGSVAFQVFVEGDALPQWEAGYGSVYLMNPSVATLEKAAADGLEPERVYGFGDPEIAGDYFFTICEVHPAAVRYSLGRPTRENGAVP